MAKRDKDAAALGDPEAWIILRFNDRMKAVVVQQLLAKGYDLYAPMTRVNRRVAGVRMTIGVPLYRGFMFIRRADASYTDTDGMIGTAGRFERGVRPALIARHRQQEQDGYIDLVVPPERAQIAIGDKVQTLDGFMDLVVTEHLEKNRVRVLTYLLGREHEMVVDLCVVRRPPDDGAGQGKGSGSKRKKKGR